jgi:glycosyltransferase involved in cell wall biosynthesis
MGYAQAMQSDRRLRPLAFPLAPLFFLSGLLAVTRLTRRWAFDVMHAHWVIPNAPIADLVARIRDIPMVISLHGSDIFVSQNNRLFGRVARRMFERAIGITACSPELFDGALALGAPKERTHLIPWGADPAIFAQPANIEDLRARWQLERDGTVVLSLARLVQKKGIEYLIRAIPAILPRHPNTRFFIVGDGPEKANLCHLVADLDIAEHVTFVGEVGWDAVPQYLHLADVFAVPSIHDEQGNVDGLPTTISYGHGHARCRQ